MTTKNNSKKSKKHLIKDKKIKKSRAKRSKRNNVIKSNSSSLSNLYTYESPVTNNVLAKSNSKLNVNIVNGLKDYLAVKK
jgi:hypothetical protein